MPFDLSAAPEIALLGAAKLPAQQPWSTHTTGPSTAGPHTNGPHTNGPHTQVTLGSLAGELVSLASRPERWWAAVRYHIDNSEKIVLEVSRVSAWVSVLVPGDQGLYCSCDLMMLIAGDAVEESMADQTSVTTTLRPGRVRVHGRGPVHQIRAAAAGFAIILHVSGKQDQPAGSGSANRMMG